MKLRIAVALGGGIGGLALYNRWLEALGGEIPDRLGGRRHRYRWRGHDLVYSVAGEGEPLLLVHGIYAGASSFEFRKNFRELSRSFRVYALDLLGCGMSDRPDRRYGTEDVTSQIEDFVREEIGGQAHLVASSLSAALVVPAAVRSPRLFRKLVLICPTGYGTLDRPSGRLGDVVYGLFRTPVLGNTLYHTIVSRWGIRYYLQGMTYHDPRFVSGDLIEDYYRIAHQPGAKYFVSAFVSGKLNLGVADLWSRVPHRTLICWGLEAKTAPAGQAQRFVANNPRSEPRLFKNAGLLPHDERAETFNEEVRTFLVGKSSNSS
ncbi:MAG TPA: alpha/beta fold hydrolase [Rubrobacter sp.]|nr:alpha/beta fold hydrolase [Rubrobacter sp.]